MTVTETAPSAAGPIAEVPGQRPIVVSGTSPLADGFRSRFFAEHDYRRFHARAPRYDAENSFFAEDFADLVKAHHLRAPLPERLGGAGLTLAELAVEQRHLAYWAPATALAVNIGIHAQDDSDPRHGRGVVGVPSLRTRTAVPRRAYRVAAPAEHRCRPRGARRRGARPEMTRHAVRCPVGEVLT